MRQPPLRTRISPWVLLFATITVWHAWRSAGADTFIFGAATVLLLVESLRPNLLGTNHRLRVRGKHAALGCTVVGLALVALPRYATGAVVVIVMVGLAAFFLSWYHLHQRYRPALTAVQRRAIHLWLAVTTALLLVEFGAYLSATASGSDERFPTITVLLDPMIDHMWGRALFAAGWLFGGWALVAVSPRADSV